jgi:hypothetical protein
MWYFKNEKVISPGYTDAYVIFWYSGQRILEIN